MKTFWMILAAACGALAVLFLIRDEFDRAFVAAAAGAVCWFLNYRQKIKESMPEEDSHNDEESDEELRS